MQKRICAFMLALLLLISGCGSLHFTAAEKPTVVHRGGDRMREPAPNCDAYPELADQLRTTVMEQTDLIVHETVGDPPVLHIVNVESDDLHVPASGAFGDPPGKFRIIMKERRSVR